MDELTDTFDNIKLCIEKTLPIDRSSKSKWIVLRRIHDPVYLEHRGSIKNEGQSYQNSFERTPQGTKLPFASRRFHGFPP